jgi:predicted negative regulator of RcsB-dependent stress response
VDDNLTDQQRAEQVRVWLRDNGWYLLAGLALGLAALFGWRQWTSYAAANAEAASAQYEELLAAIRVDRTSRAEELLRELERDHGATPYLDQARLAMARVKMDRAQPDEAARYLEQVVKDASSEEIARIASLRLGRVLVQQEKFEEALEVLEVPKDSAFAARFHEARGDAYYAMGKPEEARAEYAAAIAGADATAGDQAFLQAKLDEVSGPAAPAAAAPAAESPAPAAAQETPATAPAAN